MNTNSLSVLSWLCLLFVYSPTNYAQENPLLDSLLLRSIDAPSVSNCDGSAFTRVGTWARGICQAVDIFASYALVGDGPTMQIVNVSDPSNPQIVSHFLAGGLIEDISVSGSFAYVIAGGSLQIIDMTNPLTPLFVGGYQISGLPIQVAVTDSLAFVTTFVGSVFCIDVSDPKLPVQRDAIGSGGERPFYLAAADGFAYLGNADTPGLTIIDASNPDSLSHTFFDVGGFLGSAYIKDTLLFLGVYDILKVYSISNPGFPRLLAETQIGFQNNGIAVSDSTLFILSRGFGIVAVDISDPANPQLLAGTPRRYPVNAGRGIAASHNTVFAGMFTGLFAASLISDDSLQQESFFPTGGLSVQVRMSGNLAFVASGLSGLWIVDLTNETNPTGLANIQNGGFTLDAFVENNTLFMLNGYGGPDSVEGLWIVNVEQPSSPFIVGKYVCQDGVSIAKSGDLVFIGRDGIEVTDTVLQIINVHDLSNPYSLGALRGSSRVNNIAAKDSIVYIATSDSGLKVVDCRIPDTPVVLPGISTPARGVVIQDSILFVDGGSALVLLNVANPDTFSIIGSANRNGGSSLAKSSLSPWGDFLFWTDGDFWGAFDVANPYFPKDSVHCSNSEAFGIAASDRNVLVTRYLFGLEIYRNGLASSVDVKEDGGENISSFVVSQNFPNPFNPSTTIEYAIPTSVHVTLKVFDVLGREVLSIVDEFMPAGQHRATINGDALASGVYLYRLRAGNYTATKKLVLLK